MEFLVCSKKQGPITPGQVHAGLMLWVYKLLNLFCFMRIMESSVPERLSSAHSRIPIAGINIKNNQGCQAKKAVKSAWSRSKNRPRKKVIPEERAKKTSKKIDARGVLK